MSNVDPKKLLEAIGAALEEELGWDDQTYRDFLDRAKKRYKEEHPAGAGYTDPTAMRNLAYSQAITKVLQEDYSEWTESHIEQLHIRAYYQYLMDLNDAGVRIRPTGLAEQMDDLVQWLSPRQLRYLRKWLSEEE